MTDDTETKRSWKKMCFLEKCRYVRENITVEPMLACYIMPSVLAGLATQNLNLEKACRVNLAYGDEVCDALTRRDTANYTQEEKLVQQLVAGMAGWKTVLQSALPCLLILFWGSWSDRHGRRKPCMLIPIVGEFITAIGLILCTYFDKLPMEVAGVTEALFPGLTGGWFTMLMGIFSYIADVTTEEQRTLRIGIVNLCFSLGIPIGMAFSGILLKQIGFYGVFSISASLYLIAFFYGLFYVKESAKHKNATIEKKSIDKGVLADFFDREHVVETFRVAFKNGENQRRLRVIMLIIVVMVVIGPMHGEMSVIYLFTRYRFNWSEVEFSFFSTYGMITSLIGTMFSVGVFSHMLKIDDALIGVMSSMSKILSSFIYAFAVTDWQLYFGPIVEILNGTSFIAMRSIASKLVSKDELGKVNSLFGVAEALMPLVYAPMYTTIYAATLQTLPGAFFLLGGALTTPAVIIFLWMYRMNKADEKLKIKTEKTDKAQRQIEKIDKKLFTNDKLTTNNNGGIHIISYAYNIAEKQQLPSTTNVNNCTNETTTQMNNLNIVDKNDKGVTNHGFICNDDNINNTTTIIHETNNQDRVLNEAVEIVKDLPALYLEHCKL